MTAEAPATPHGDLQVTVLGCGTSTGVPVIGCACDVCRSDEPKNKRLRSGLALRFGERTVLVDTSPDLRQQCLRYGIERVDAVLYTHAHADHILGLDDLRPFNFRQREPVACFGSRQTLEHLRRTFSYAFDGVPSEGGGKPRLETAAVEGAFDVFGLEVEALTVLHGSLEVTAYRVGPFAYVTDCHYIPEATFEGLQGVQFLILDALRYTPHPTHFSVAEAIDAADRIGATQTYLTHMNHDIDYNAPAVELPPGVELAYDGLTVTV
ncbi:MAG: MBL fold metallo-hydrolase [Acidobacteriota bacterium]